MRSIPQRSWLPVNLRLACSSRGLDQRERASGCPYPVALKEDILPLPAHRQKFAALNRVNDHFPAEIFPSLLASLTATEVIIQDMALS